MTSSSLQTNSTQQTYDDTASTLYDLQPGDRLHVLIDDAMPPCWWGATLLEDRMSVGPDHEVIRMIQFDPIPDHLRQHNPNGGPFRSTDVIFGGNHSLCVLGDEDDDADEWFNFRCEEDAGEDEGVATGALPKDRDLLNAVLTCQLTDAMQQEDRATQLALVDLLRAGKEQLLDLLMNHQGALYAHHFEMYMERLAGHAF